MTVTTIVVVDTETSDLDPEAGAKLMELAAIPLQMLEGGDQQGWEVTDAGFCHYIEFDGECSPVARATHHIDPASCTPGAPNCFARDHVIGQMQQAEVPDEMLYAAHNAPFDRAFLRDLELPWIDTLQCAKHVWPDAPSHKNMALRYWLGLEPLPHYCVDERGVKLEAHRALYDAAVTAELLRVMLIDRSAEELLRLTNTPLLLKTCNFPAHKGKPWSEVPLDYLSWMRRKGVGADDANLQHTISHYLDGRAA